MREAAAHNPRTCQKELQQLWSALRVGAYAMGGFPDPRSWEGNGFLLAYTYLTNLSVMVAAKQNKAIPT